MAVRTVLEGAARQIGGMDRLTVWIKESPQNEYAFWTQMWLRLLPVKVEGSGPRGEIELSLKIQREELARRLEERGLPLGVLGVDKPVLELKAEPAPATNGGQSPKDSGEVT